MQEEQTPRHVYVEPVNKLAASTSQDEPREGLRIDVQAAGFPFHAPTDLDGNDADVVAPAVKPSTFDSGRANTSPLRRKSVQFSRTSTNLPRPESSETRGTKPNIHTRRSSTLFLSKIRSLASPSFPPAHRRTQSDSYMGDDPTSQVKPNASNMTNLISDGEPQLPMAQVPTTPRPTNGNTPRPDLGESPKESNKPQRATMRSRQSTTAPRRRRHLPIRRATDTDLETSDNRGLSEDEGKSRMSNNLAWRRRGSAWLHAGQEVTSPQSQSGPETPVKSRPGHLRRITQLAGGSSTGDGSPSAAGQKWRQLKAGIRLLGQKKRAEHKVDYAKSAELMAELLAGSPAALILASNFQRDERKKKKVPVLLEQLKISITETKRMQDGSGDRHVRFRIELEYGSGLMRMKWVIYRYMRDFLNLHARYKVQTSKMNLKLKNENQLRAKLPRFPKSAFPYLRGIRGLGDEDGDDEAAPEEAGTEDDRADTVDRLAATQDRSSSNRPSDNLAASSDDPDRAGDVSQLATGPYAERQRRKLEIYLRELIRFLIFRAGSNRLCKFLELSALGIRLAAEGGYHGKEGVLTLLSGKGVDARKRWKPQLLLERHKPMWFLVRHSYIVCVDSPEEMNIYDVFLVDPEFRIHETPRLRDQKSASDFAKTAKHAAGHSKHHTIRLSNSERTMNLLARNERHQDQFTESISFMQKNTDWAKEHRFGSFAPVRENVFAQWLVDARDYMWNVSRAISMAQDVIYIHDWWLSPELFLRRPAAISQKWRLDRLLKRKAEEGVKIFIIMYRNINSAIPIDSEYSKYSLLDLHPNIFVQRSPNQYRQNVFFWAHHEKLCVIDHTIAFCGGVDLCFGRWDTPQHLVVDDKKTGFEPSDFPKDADHCQLWPGKDYSNPRVLDFFGLDEPYREMYDRERVPRMPWHDIGMQIIGQPARDLTRHFVQRWNYILRQRTPTRPTPFLLPPPDFNPSDLEALGLDGTCEIQMLRSASEWSLGTPNKVECSILNAYIKLIEMSEHFVYIENQFFITSCVVEGTAIKNTIGEALLGRIIKAHEKGEDWLAIVIIPLMPGFQNTVDNQDGTSVRLIMQCQYWSICRGENSLFEKLRAVGIVPEDYIQFYSLRSWGKIGPNKALVSEQLYIHAKCMVVDDRYAIIGSANINERSMLGSRDSEVAAHICDKDMIDSVMAGKPYRVGRFPHTLRMRLMREHLGLDVDCIMEDEREHGYDERDVNPDNEDEESSLAPVAVSDSSIERKLIESKNQRQDDLIAQADGTHTFNHDADWEQEHNPHLRNWKKVTSDSRVMGNALHKQDVDGFGPDQMQSQAQTPASKGRDSVVLDDHREVLVNSVSAEGKGTLSSLKNSQRVSSPMSTKEAAMFRSDAPLPPQSHRRLEDEDIGLTPLKQLPSVPATDDSDINGPTVNQTFSRASTEAFSPLLTSLQRPVVDDDCMKDPLDDKFFHDTWHTVAENNTKLFRQVFRCMPDNEVRNWKDYEAFQLYSERFNLSQGLTQTTTPHSQEAKRKTGPPGVGVEQVASDMQSKKDKVAEKLETFGKDGVSDVSEKNGVGLSDEARPSTKETSTSERTNGHSESDGVNGSTKDASLSSLRRPVDGMFDSSRAVGIIPGINGESVVEKQGQSTNHDANEELGSSHSSTRRRRRATTKSRASDAVLVKAEAEELMNLVQGHLVVFPYDWLEEETRGSKWLYPVDSIAPLEIYD